MITIISLMVMTSIFFMSMNHPVSLMIMIFIQAILTSMTCGMLTNMWWFSYMLFMTTIGGLLVLFMYMTNVASNEKFFIKMKFIMWTIPIMILILYSIYNNHKIHLSNWINTENINTELILMKYYNYPSNFILILIMMFLLITMIMSVKITELKKGALRQKT